MEEGDVMSCGCPHILFNIIRQCLYYEVPNIHLKGSFLISW